MGYKTLVVLILYPALVFADEWKLSAAWPGGPLLDQCAKRFASQLEFLTEGRIKVHVFSAGVLGNPLQLTDAVKNGIAEAAHTWPGYDWGKDRTGVLFGGFAGSPNSELLIHWLYEGGGFELWQKWRGEKFDVVAFPLCIRATEVFLHSNKPVRSLEDLKGMKIRTTGAWVEILNQLGASAVSVAGGDVFPMLERKAIDGTEWGSFYENWAMGFHKVARYVVIPGIHQPSSSAELLVNKRTWDRVSERDKKLVEMAAKITSLEYWAKGGQEDAKYYKLMQASESNEITELGPEVRIRVKTLAKEWAEKNAQSNVWFKQVYDHQRQFAELWRDSDRYRMDKNL